jgi:Secretion system C-terminal sorting domain
LVQSNIGASTFNGVPGIDTASNDPGLNAILQAYNITYYMEKGGHIYPPFLGRFTETMCETSQVSQLVNDLLAYSSVIENVRVTVYGSPFNDCLYAEINSLGVGTPVGFNNEIVVTNDDGLNQIFEDFNVYYYELSFPGAIGEALQRTYSVVCNCDNTQLKIALDNYTNVINYTEFINPGYLLNTMDFENTNLVLAPNPFTTTFSIQTKESILNYSLFDSVGKQILNTNSKSDLDAISSQLNSGMYLLNLQFENGSVENYKIIKN